MVVQLSAGPERFISLGAVHVKAIRQKESSAIDHARLGFTCTPNLSDEANWEHIGSEVQETGLSGVTFLLRFPDSLQCLQPRWRTRESLLGG